MHVNFLEALSFEDIFNYLEVGNIARTPHVYQLVAIDATQFDGVGRQGMPRAGSLRKQSQYLQQDVCPDGPRLLYL